MDSLYNLKLSKMKKLLFQATLAVFAIFCAGNVLAQDLTVTHTAEGEFAAALATALDGTDPLTIKNLVIVSNEANMNYADFVAMRTTLTQVETVDISAVTLAGNRLPAQTAYEKNGSFSRLAKLKSVVLPDGIISLGGGSFIDCPMLETVNLPSSVKNIESYAFQNCSLLVMTELPADLEQIYQMAFKDCKKVSFSVLPAGVKGIALEAFNGCSNVTFSVWPEGITSIGNTVFRNTKVAFTDWPAGVAQIPTGVFANCITVTNFTIPETVTSLPSTAFFVAEGTVRTFTCKNLNPPTSGTTDQYQTFGEKGKSLTSTTLNVLRKAHSNYAATAPYSNMTIKDITRNVTVTIEGDGTVADDYEYADLADGLLVAYEGDDVTFTLTPDASWSVSELKLNGVDVKDDMSGMSYTIPALGTEDYTLAVKFDFSSGIGDDKEDTATVSISPNPTSDVITVSGNISSDVKVYDSTGRQVIRTNESVIDVSSFNPGVYLVKVDGKTFKVIKK